MPDYAKSLLEDRNHEKLLSIASVWEIAIKHGIGKLALADPPGIYLQDILRRGGIDLLPIQFDHAVHAGSLPLHNKDPFDRLLAAQCLIEGVRLVSADAILDAYGVVRMWDKPAGDSGD
jgi:PIN domain nuclease of toxin-antitoxin system